MEKSNNYNNAIDACRPGDVFGLNENDLSGKEMSGLREALASDNGLQSIAKRSAGLDRCIGVAFANLEAIEPPPGLADRLFASLEAAASNDADSDSLDAERSPVDLSESKESPRIDSAATSRRKWLGAGLLVCGAVAACALVGFFLIQPQNITRDQLIDEVVVNGGWIDQSIQREQDGEGWATDFTLAPTLRPQDSIHLARDAAGWRYTPLPFDRNAVEYDLRIQPSERYVFCYVLGHRGEVADLPTAPPIKPQSISGGWTVAAWQTNDLIYVLAVEGDRTRYQQLRKQFDIAMILNRETTSCVAG